jgi:hypothetical protein
VVIDRDPLISLGPLLIVTSLPKIEETKSR